MTSEDSIVSAMSFPCGTTRSVLFLPLSYVKSHDHCRAVTWTAMESEGTLFRNLKPVRP